MRSFKRLAYRIKFPFRKWLAYKKITINQQDFYLQETTARDIKGLLDVERAIYKDHLPWTRSAFLSEIYHVNKHLYLSLFNEEQICGFIGSRINQTDCHITNIGILPTYQNNGLGHLLIDEIQKFAIMNRCKTLSLELRISNKDAQRLYRSLGFVSQTVQKNYYTETNEDAIEMIKNLEEE